MPAYTRINFEFHNDEGGYEKRIHASWKLNIIICALLGLVMMTFANWFFALLLAIFLYIVQDFKALRDNSYFIYSICSDRNTVEINYYYRREVKHVTIPLSEIRLKKKFGWESTPNPYMVVYHKDFLVIKQFENGDWTRKKMDEVIREINHLKVLNEQ